MKRILLLLMVSFCAMIASAQGFKDLVDHNMTLKEFGKLNNSGGYEWKVDKQIHEDWMIQSDGRIKQTKYNENTTNYTYYTISSDGKTLYQYSDKEKRIRINTLKYVGTDTEIGFLLLMSTLVIINDVSNIQRIFYVF